MDLTVRYDICSASEHHIYTKTMWLTESINPQYCKFDLTEDSMESWMSQLYLRPPAVFFLEIYSSARFLWEKKTILPHQTK